MIFFQLNNNVCVKVDLHLNEKNEPYLFFEENQLDKCFNYSQNYILSQDITFGTFISYFHKTYPFGKNEAKEEGHTLRKAGRIKNLSQFQNHKIRKNNHKLEYRYRYMINCQDTEQYFSANLNISNEYVNCIKFLLQVCYFFDEKVKNISEKRTLVEEFTDYVKTQVQNVLKAAGKKI